MGKARANGGEWSCVLYRLCFWYGSASEGLNVQTAIGGKKQAKRGTKGNIKTPRFWWVWSQLKRHRRNEAARAGVRIYDHSDELRRTGCQLR